MNICSKHGKDGILYCIDHNINNICLDCLNYDHSNCKLQTAKKRKIYEGSCENLTKDEKLSIKKSKNEIKDKEKVNPTSQNQDRFEKCYIVIHNDFSVEIVLKQRSMENINFEQYDSKRLFKLLSESPYSIINSIHFKNYNFEILSYFWKSKGVVKKINLERLKLDSSTLDKFSKFFSRSSNLQEINLGENDEIGKSGHSVFENLNNSYDSLKSLHVHCCKLDEENINKISDLFSHCSQLVNINLRKNTNVGNTTNTLFRNLCPSALSLETLDFSECDLNQENLRQLSYLFSHCSCLKSVNLSDNKMVGSQNCSIFENLCKSSNTLETLDLSYCYLNTKNIGNVSNLLSCCSFLKCINLKKSDISACDNNSIFENLIKSLKSLENLNFDCCNLNEGNVKGVCDLLSQCQCLKEIIFSFNKCIGSKKYLIFKNWSNFNTTLETLDLSGCDLNEDNLEHISDLLSCCMRLKFVNFDFNEMIGCTKHPVLENLCNSSTYLETLQISNCDLNEEVIEKLSNLFSKCSNLKKIDLSENENIGVSRYPIFDNLCKSSQSLEYVRIVDCNLNYENSRKVLDFFSVCTNLRELYFEGNHNISSCYEVSDSLHGCLDTLESVGLPFQFDEDPEGMIPNRLCYLFAGI